MTEDSPEGEDGPEYDVDFREHSEEREPEEWADPAKRESAELFEEYLERVRNDEEYRRLKEEHQESTS